MKTITKRLVPFHPFQSLLGTLDAQYFSATCQEENEPATTMIKNFGYPIGVPQSYMSALMTTSYADFNSMKVSLRATHYFQP